MTIRKKHYTFALKVQFEERNGNFVGFFWLLASTSDQSVMKSNAVVNYYSEKFLKKFRLTTSWTKFMNQLDDEAKLLGELVLEEHTEKLQALYMGYPPDRVMKLTEYIVELGDRRIQTSMVNGQLEADLKCIFPQGDFSFDFVNEFVEVRNKTKDEIAAEEDDDEEEDEEEEDEEEEDEDEEDEEDEDEKKKRKKEKKKKKKEKEEEEDKGPKTVLVEPVFDPVEGVVAKQLRAHDIVTVVRENQQGKRLVGYIISSRKLDRKHLLITVELADHSLAEMQVAPNTMIKGEHVKADSVVSAGPPYVIIIVVSIIIITALSAAAYYLIL